MKEILVLCPFGVDKGLLSKAARLSGGELRALVPAGEAETAAEYGAGRIFELSAPEIGDESAFAAFLSETIRRWGSQIVLAPATVRMRNIMPMLAWQLDAGLTADCTALRMEGEQLIQTRPAFGNSLMADIRSLSEIQMATVRPGTFRPERQAVKTPTVETITYTPDERVKLHSFGSFAQGKPLSQAEIIVAGGMGVGSKAGFEKLEALAKKLGGSLGCVPHGCGSGVRALPLSGGHDGNYGLPEAVSCRWNQRCGAALGRYVRLREGRRHQFGPEGTDFRLCRLWHRRRLGGRC